MKTEESTKFDCVKFMREARRKNYEETKHLGGKEYDEYWRKFRQTNPVWQRWVARQNAVKQQTSDTSVFTELIVVESIKSKRLFHIIEFT